MTTSLPPGSTAVVVDDSLEQAGMLAGILIRLGIAVVAVCDSGPTGLAAIRSYKPTIATVDIQMPVMNGLELVAAAKADRTSTLLVMCSGTSQKQVQDQARAAGAAAFIVKPYDQILVERELRALLAR